MKVGFFLLLTAMALLLLLAGCGGGATATPAPTPTPTPVPDPAAILARAADRIAAAESLAFALEHPAGSTQLSPGLLLTRAAGVANRPDRFQIKLELETAGSFLELEVIGIGDRTWMTNLLSGEWESVPPAAVPLSFNNAGQVFADIIAAVENPQLAGTERVADANGGYNAWRIQGTLPGAALASALPGATLPDTAIPITVWADQAETRLPRVELSGPLVAGDLPEVTRLLTLELREPAAEIAAPGGG